MSNPTVDSRILSRISHDDSLKAENLSAMYSKYGEKSKSKVGNEGREIFGQLKVGSEMLGQLKDGREISGKEKVKSGNLSHSGRENFNHSKETSGQLNERFGNFSHSGRENFSHSNEISGQAKLKLKRGNVKVRAAGQASVGKLGKEIVGKLNLGRDGNEIFGKLSLGKAILGKERFLGGSR